MRARTLTLKLRGPLLVGGHSGPVSDADAGTARDVGGQVVVPGSALKGALRQAVRDLVLAEGGNACEGPWSPCREEPCAVCVLFGRSGPNRPLVVDADGGLVPSGGVRVSDAVRVSGGQAELAVRNGVAIDRWTGSAAPGRLYRREVFEGGAGARFDARIEGNLDDASWQLLERALPLVEGIGNSTSRGFGEVVRLELGDGGKRPASVSLSGLGRDRVLVTLTAEEPLCLGGLPDPGFYRDSERFVSGGTLLGAVTAAASAGNLLEGDRVDGLEFSDLHPGPGSLSIPMPRCSMRCRSCDRSYDRSLHQAAGRHLAAAGLGQPLPPACPKCHGVLKPAAGWLNGIEPRSRVVTRLAIDPMTRSAAPEHLHAREQIEAGSTFTGTCRVGESGRALLEAIVAQALPIRVGGLRSRGLGTVRVDISGTRSDLDRRIEEYRARAAELLAPCDLPWKPEALVLAACRTDLAGGQGDVLAACGPDARVLTSWARRRFRSGWDGASGGPRAVREVVAAGSCWLVEAPNADLGQLSAAETDGVGQDRVLGLGRLHLSPRIEG